MLDEGGEERVFNLSGMEQLQLGYVLRGVLANMDSFEKYAGLIQEDKIFLVR